MTIAIEVRSVYGRETYYPANDAARSFARIAGTRTLLPGVIQEARKLGFKVLVVNTEMQEVAAAMFAGNVGAV